MLTTYLVKAETVRKAENYANIEISKITKWAKDNKITFNEQKSKAMVVTRKKRRENKEISGIYLNNKPLEQVTTSNTWQSSWTAN